MTDDYESGEIPLENLETVEYANIEWVDWVYSTCRVRSGELLSGRSQFLYGLTQIKTSPEFSGRFSMFRPSLILVFLY